VFPVDDLFRAARFLIGDAGTRAFARLLGPHHPEGPRESIDDRLVRRWSAGQREIPAWVPAAVVTELRREATAMMAAADALEVSRQNFFRENG
jgi:hypothetical protein